MLNRVSSVISGASVFHSPPETKSKLIPLFPSPLQCGFPSPAGDYLDNELSLHELLIANPNATFFGWAAGDSMRDADIGGDDLLIVDKSLEPRDGDVVVFSADGDFFVKRFIVEKNGAIRLRAENSDFPPIAIQGFDEVRLFGVVTSRVKFFRKNVRANRL